MDNDESDYSTDHYGTDPNPWATRAVKAEADLAALRAQLAAAEERARKAEAERDEARVLWATSAAWAKAAMEDRDIVKPEEISAFLTMKHGSDDAIRWLAASRADAVREFAEWLMLRWSGNNVRQYWEGHVTDYLSSFGVLRARPDDGRVERVIQVLMKRTWTWERDPANARKFAEQLVAAADGDKA